jgi:hypothetical protein
VKILSVKESLTASRIQEYYYDYYYYYYPPCQHDMAGDSSKTEKKQANSSSNQIVHEALQVYDQSGKNNMTIIESVLDEIL